jgi:hypothetical protein
VTEPTPKQAKIAELAARALALSLEIEAERSLSEGLPRRCLAGAALDLKRAQDRLHKAYAQLAAGDLAPIMGRIRR